MDKLDEMDKFLKTHKPPRLNHEKIKNLNRPITSEETESVIKILNSKSSSGPRRFTG